MVALEGPEANHWSSVLLIVNPASRRGLLIRRAAVRAFTRRGVRCDVMLTEQPGHAAELASGMGRGGGYQAVFTLGGDGTAMEVVGALAHTGIPVGVLPGGTGNLVARSLGIPLRVERAVGFLLDGVIASIDLGILNGSRPFAFAAGVGIDAEMIRQTSPWLKRRVGVGAYVLSGMRATLNRKVFRVSAEVDGQTTECDAVAVMVANFGSVLNDLIRLGPRIRQDDGNLDLCVFSPENTMDAVRIAWRLLRKDFSATKGVAYRAGHSFRITCFPPQSFQADGEVIGSTPFTAVVDPLAARLLMPR